jgi:hypothetical protein
MTVTAIKPKKASEVINIKNKKRGRPDGSKNKPLRTNDLPSPDKAREQIKTEAVFKKRGPKPRIDSDSQSHRVVLDKEDTEFINSQSHATGLARSVLIARYVSEARYRIQKQGGISDFQTFVNWAAKSKERAPGCEALVLAAEKYYAYLVRKQQKQDKELAEHSVNHN